MNDFLLLMKHWLSSTYESIATFAVTKDNTTSYLQKTQLLH